MAAAVRVCCVSDTHGDEARLGALPPCDVLVHAGDVTLYGRAQHARAFEAWGKAQPLPTERRILVLGNHENRWVQDAELGALRALLPSWTVLCDEAHEVGGLRFFGTSFRPDADSAGQTVEVPAGVDVLVTHNPPHGHLDGGGGGHVALRRAAEAVGPKLHVFGHVHGGAGTERVGWRGGVGTLLVNAAMCGPGGPGGSERKCCNLPIVVAVTPGDGGDARLA